MRHISAFFACFVLMAVFGCGGGGVKSKDGELPEEYKKASAPSQQPTADLKKMDLPPGYPKPRN